MFTMTDITKTKVQAQQAAAKQNRGSAAKGHKKEPKDVYSNEKGEITLKKGDLSIWG